MTFYDIKKSLAKGNNAHHLNVCSRKIIPRVIPGCCSPWNQFMFCIYNKGQMSLQFPAEISVGLVLLSLTAWKNAIAKEHGKGK